MTLEQAIGIIIACLIIIGLSLTKAKTQFLSDDDVKQKKLRKIKGQN